MEIVQAVERARHAREHGGGDERDHLVLRHVEAHRLPPRCGCRAMAMIARPVRLSIRLSTTRQREQHQAQSPCRTSRSLVNARRAGGAVDHDRPAGIHRAEQLRVHAVKRERLCKHVRVGRAGNEFLRAGPHRNVQAVEDVAHDLAERERYDGEVVAAQTQHRQCRSARPQCRPPTPPVRSWRAAGRRPRWPSPDTARSATRPSRCRHNAPTAHEARVTEAQLAGNADRQVQRNGHERCTRRSA